MSGSSLLESAGQAIGDAATPTELKRAIDVWAPRFHDELGGRLVSGPRPKLRIDITRIPGWGGFTARRGDSFFVGVGEGGGREARFTLAHELAHVVLNGGECGRLELQEEEEEDLCDHFAHRALAPPALIRAHFAEHGTPRSLADVERFAARFRITLRFSLAAIDEFLPAQWPVCFVAASWRTHPRGDDVHGLRVDVSASDERLFMPRDCRLSTLGYSELEAWVINAEVGASHNGREDGARLKSGRPGVTAWIGESRWIAQRHYAPASNAADDRPAALCMLEVSKLSPAPRRRRRPAGAGSDRRRPAARIPGQLDLTTSG